MIIFVFLLLLRRCTPFLFFFFFNDTATTEIYTLSLHDALPIWFGTELSPLPTSRFRLILDRCKRLARSKVGGWRPRRSEEHTSELQSQSNLVCRLLLEKKKKKKIMLQCRIQLKN